MHIKLCEVLESPGKISLSPGKVLENFTEKGHEPCDLLATRIQTAD